jgi:hypothetical protein
MNDGGYTKYTESVRAAVRADALTLSVDHGRAITIAQPSITRPAIAHALRDQGYLTHRSVRIRYPIPWLKTGSISL